MSPFSAECTRSITFSCGGWIGIVVLDLAGVADSTIREKGSGSSSTTLSSMVEKNQLVVRGRQAGQSLLQTGFNLSNSLSHNLQQNPCFLQQSHGYL